MNDINPAESARVNPVKHMPQLSFSRPAPDVEHRILLMPVGYPAGFLHRKTREGSRRWYWLRALWCLSAADDEDQTENYCFDEKIIWRQTGDAELLFPSAVLIVHLRIVGLVPAPPLFRDSGQVSRRWLSEPEGDL